MDKILADKLEIYYQKFGDVFPMMEYNLPISDVIKFINKCIKLNKKATEIIPLDEKVIY